jgi:hypothetical protein
MYLRWILNPAPSSGLVRPGVIGGPSGLAPSAGAEGDDRFKVLLMEHGHASGHKRSRPHIVRYLGSVHPQRMTSPSSGWYYRAVFWDKVRRRLAGIAPDVQARLLAELEAAVPPPPPELDAVVARALCGPYRGAIGYLNARYHAWDVPLAPLNLPQAAQRQIACQVERDVAPDAWLDEDGPPLPSWLRPPDGQAT